MIRTMCDDTPIFKHGKERSESIPGEIQEVIEIFEAVRKCSLPPPLVKPVRKVGRKSYNRFLIISLILCGLKRGWSFRQIQEFAKTNWDYLKELSFNIKKEPDHSTIYLVASKLRVVDIFRYHAKLKELKGEVPVLWF
ncbi:hypothetical protein [Archaeoglobus sp.]